MRTRSSRVRRRIGFAALLAVMLGLVAFTGTTAPSPSPTGLSTGEVEWTSPAVVSTSAPGAAARDGSWLPFFGIGILVLAVGLEVVRRARDRARVPAGRVSGAEPSEQATEAALASFQHGMEAVTRHVRAVIEEAERSARERLQDAQQQAELLLAAARETGARVLAEARTEAQATRESAAAAPPGAPGSSRVSIARIEAQLRPLFKEARRWFDAVLAGGPPHAKRRR